MDTPITRAEHEEFMRRMEVENQRLSDEDGRQNKRIDELEKKVNQLDELTTSVKELAISMKSMLKEQEKQGDRLTALESRDGEMWRNVIRYIITAIIGIVIGFIFTQIGL